jgi:hypothetical protein
MKSIRSLFLLSAFLIYAPLMLAAETGPATGTVVETISSGGYVYLKLEEQGIWIAANTFAVSKGDRIQYSGGMEMNDFHSKSLDRTFESIFFVQSASLVGNGGDTGSAAMIEAHANRDMSLKKSVAAQAPAAGEITPLKEGKTVAAIFAESADLNGQVVRLKVRVVKISKDIMGRNWITLQDGTGTEPDNMLRATSQEVVSAGDVVIVKGTVATDVDLGYGYNYKVLLEEATFVE